MNEEQKVPAPVDPKPKATEIPQARMATSQPEKKLFVKIAVPLNMSIVEAAESRPNTEVVRGQPAKTKDGAVRGKAPDGTTKPNK